MKQAHIIVFHLFFLFCASQTIYAQNVKENNRSSSTECNKKLDEAKNMYNSGLFFEAEELARGVITGCKLNKSGKQDAYEVLIKSLLETDKITEADSVRIQMLKENPNYELKETGNSEEFQRFIKAVNVRPLFSVGFRNTLLHPSLPISKVFFVLEDVDYSVPYTTISNINNSAKWFLRYYGWVEYEFKKNISLNVEFTAFTLNYSRSFEKNDDWEMNYSEKMNFTEIPVYIKKYLPLSKNVQPYVTLGAGCMRMNSAKANAEINYLKKDAIEDTYTTFSAAVEDVNVLAMRKRISYEWIAGTGIGYRFRNFSMSADFRYYGGFGSFTKPADRFNSATPLIDTYYYIDSAVKLNKYEIGISLSYTLKSAITKNNK